MRLLKNANYPKKIQLSFTLLIGVLVISTVSSLAIVQSIFSQFQKERQIKEIIGNVAVTRQLAGDYVLSPSRPSAQLVFQQLETTANQIQAMLAPRQSGLETKMPGLLKEFEKRFQQHVIELDRAAALKSQANLLGEKMVKQISRFNLQALPADDRQSLNSATNQILIVLWQGQMLLGAEQLQPLSDTRLAPLRQQLAILSAQFQDKSFGSEKQRSLYRIHRDTRNYVGSFEKYLHYREKIGATRDRLHQLSSQLHLTGNRMEREVQAEMEQHLLLGMLLLGLFFVVFVISAIFLAQYLAGEIVRPVRRLVAATERIAEGDLSVIVAAEANDEIGQLANCLNQMTTRLRSNRAELLSKHQALADAAQELEERVQERTAQLAVANKSLEAEVLTRKHSEQLIRTSEAKFRAMFELSPLGIYRTSLEGKILECNQAFAEILRDSQENILFQNEKILTPTKYANQERQRIQALEKFGRYGPYERQFVKASGKPVPVRLNGMLIEGDQEPSIWSIVEDITDQKRSEEMIWRQANFDSLTGLPNRRMFRNTLTKEISRARRSNRKLALMLLDLDKFKEVNDTLGHDKGDLLLVEAADRIRCCIRESDEVARLGGDEFTLIVSQIQQPEDLIRISRNIIQSLSAPFVLDNQPLVIGASIGITIFPDDGESPDKLISNADQAMYSAKSEGRNCFSFFTPNLQRKAVKRLKLINELRDTLANNQLRLLYQPIVDLRTNEIPKAEALLRWQHPELGMISPDEFIPLAEETGIIIEIGDWVVEQVLDVAQQFCSRQQKIQISINKSPVQFKLGSENLSRWIEKIRRMGLPPQYILVEITEGLLLDATDKIRQILYAYRDEGIQVALDDFGTGYSSLAYLNKFDIDYLKIDRAFISNLTEQSSELALYEAIIAMAHKLGLKVIAEGIETAQQDALLRKMGCDYGQGYLYAKPIPFEHLIEMRETPNRLVQTI